MFCSFSHSTMDTAENNLTMYQDYSFDYNYSCNQDPSPELPSGNMVLPVLYYMLFCLGLLGMFKKALSLKEKNKYAPLSWHILK